MYKLPKDQLYVTYFEGDPKNGLEPDLEAKKYWLDIGVAEDHIIPGNAKDNFWGTSDESFHNTLFMTIRRDGRDGAVWTLQVLWPRIFHDSGMLIPYLRLSVRSTSTE